VAEGSEKFAWKLFPHDARCCRQCGKEPLRVKDVGEHRTLYPHRTTEFLCVDCQSSNTTKAVEENRRALGLEASTPRSGS
jgi:hypothetical protein